MNVSFPRVTAHTEQKKWASKIVRKMGVIIVYFLETNTGVPNVIYPSEQKKWLSSILRNFESIIISCPGGKKINDPNG